MEVLQIQSFIVTFKDGSHTVSYHMLSRHIDNPREASKRPVGRSAQPTQFIITVNSL